MQLIVGGCEKCAGGVLRRAVEQAVSRTSAAPSGIDRLSQVLLVSTNANDRPPVLPVSYLEPAPSYRGRVAEEQDDEEVLAGPSEALLAAIDTLGALVADTRTDMNLRSWRH